MKVEYVGYQPSSSNETVNVVEASALTAQVMWTKYVSQRRPVLINGLSPDLATVAKSWTSEELARIAGPKKLQVEIADNDGQSFGKGMKQEMTFEAFLKSLEQNTENLYLTTQDIPTNEATGAPQYVAASPAAEMLNAGAPLRPHIMGNLIPATVNVWMGNNKHGSRTGLHFDYHDNIYILKNGIKKFKLFAPAEARNLYVEGEISVVHSNGRINFKGFATRADGVVEEGVKAEAALDARQTAEQELEKAEAALQNGEEGAQNRVRNAESALEVALDSMLETDGFGEDDFDFDGADDYVDSDEEDAERNGAFTDSIEDDDDDDASEGFVPIGEKRQLIWDGQGKNGYDNKGSIERPCISKTCEPNQKKSKCTNKKKADQVDPTELPLNFSRIGDQLDDVDRHKFPLFQKACLLECTVKAGQMLYMPAGWFHQILAKVPNFPFYCPFNAVRSTIFGVIERSFGTYTMLFQSVKIGNYFSSFFSNGKSYAELHYELAQKMKLENKVEQLSFDSLFMLRLVWWHASTASKRLHLSSFFWYRGRTCTRSDRL